MANVKRNLTKVAPKKVKPSRMQVKSLEFQYIGNEPITVDMNDSSARTRAYNWYTYMCSDDEAFEYVLKYMSESETYTKNDIAMVKKAPKYSIPNTAGWFARMLSNGNQANDHTYFKSKVEQAIEAGKKVFEEESQASSKIEVNVQDRIKSKTSALLCELEEELDNNLDFSLYSFLQAKQVTPNIANHIKIHYQGHYDEVFDVEDSQIKEAFGKALKGQQAFWQKFMDDIERFVGNVKATKVRKPRAKKTKSAVDLVKNVKFQKEFAPLKIVSINPAEIIGSQQLWVYHTKYRRLIRYDASGPSGFGVKGTTLIGFDEDKSAFKTLRKPENIIGDVLKSGKVTLRRLMNDIKSVEGKPTGRLNNDVVLLRAIK